MVSESMREIADEFSAAMSMGGDWCRRLGISDQARLMYPGPVTAAQISTSDGLFEFGGDIEALVHPVFEHGAFTDVIDLIAYDPTNPEQWWLRAGVATALGNECFETAWIFKVPLPMFQTPLSWLHNRGAGLCILNWQAMRFDVAEIAEGPGVIPENVDHGIEVERKLDPPRPKPKILIPRVA